MIVTGMGAIVKRSISPAAGPGMYQPVCMPGKAARLAVAFPMPLKAIGSGGGSQYSGQMSGNVSSVAIRITRLSRLPTRV